VKVTVSVVNARSGERLLSCVIHNLDICMFLNWQDFAAVELDNVSDPISTVPWFSQDPYPDVVDES